MNADADEPTVNGGPAEDLHDGAQTQLDDRARDEAGVGASSPDDTEEPSGATEGGAAPTVAAAPPVPVAGQASASSAPGRSSEPPGIRHGGNRQPSLAPTGAPDGEVDTRA